MVALDLLVLQGGDRKKVGRVSEDGSEVVGGRREMGIREMGIREDGEDGERRKKEGREQRTYPAAVEAAVHCGRQDAHQADRARDDYQRGERLEPGHFRGRRGGGRRGEATDAIEVCLLVLVASAISLSLSRFLLSRFALIGNPRKPQNRLSTCTIILYPLFLPLK